jgi:hypothetical protein
VLVTPQAGVGAVAPSADSAAPARWGDQGEETTVAADLRLDERLASWRAAGLLDADQVSAILAHEASAADPRPGPGSGRPSVAEAIGYVGAALVFAAVALFLGQVWAELTVGGQLTLATLVTVASAGAAFGLALATTESLRRLVSVLTVGVVAGGAWTTSIVALDVVGLRDDPAAVVISGVAVLLAAAGYRWHPRALPQLTLLVAVLALGGSLLSLPQVDPDPLWGALSLATVGGVWVMLAAGGYLRPRVLASTAGSLVAVLSLVIGSFGDHRGTLLVLATLVAGGLVAAAVVSGGVHHLAVGAIGLFLAVPQLVFEWFGDAIGAPAALLLVGVLLVLLAVGLGRARREVLTSGGAP